MKFAWSDEAQGAFEELRHRLVTTPTLAFPDYELPFILDSDASNVGIGAVLSQHQSDGSERVIAYGSRTLSRPERRYCVTRRELLAVVTCSAFPTILTWSRILASYRSQLSCLAYQLQAT